MHKNLKFRSDDGLEIRFFLRGNRIIIEGDSATGKTYVWKQLNAQNAEKHDRRRVRHNPGGSFFALLCPCPAVRT